MSTTIEAPVPERAPEHAPVLEPIPENYLTARRTILSWALTTDHKRVAVLFLFATGIGLAIGGFFALVLRTEHLTPGKTIVDAMTYNRLFTLHGVVMVWIFMLPAIPNVFGNFFLPIMIGAKDVAFPRLNIASFWIYVLGSLVILWAMLVNAVDTGWTFYVPYSDRSPTAVVPVLLGIFILGWSSIISGVNFIVTVHTMRARGLGWMKVPLFVWSIYATSIIQILATPILAFSVGVVALDRAYDLGIFDPARGGDPVLFQHLFWFYSHPAVYIMILPAMGVVSEVVCAFSRKAPLSYRAIAYSSFGIAFVGFLTWGHHMFVAGMSRFDAGAFGVLSMLVAIFSAIKVFTWVGTLRKGSISLKVPLLYVFAFLFLFVFGGMTGVAVASTSLDVHWHDTYFVVAHFHFIMVGGTLTSYLAALHYWFPKITGRKYYDRLGILATTFVAMGFFVTFFPQFLLGNAGMPRRYYDYAPRYQALHIISTLGSWVLGVGLIITLAYLVHGWLRGPRSEDNPWGALGYEWRTSSPPPVHNFHETPKMSPGPYDYASEEES